MALSDWERPVIKFTKDHEWIKEVNGEYVVGITDYAQTELGDVVFVDLPAAGAELGQGDTALNVESVKAVSDVYAPVAGKVTAVNEELNDSPQLVNESPLENGWLVKMEISEASQLESLMDETAYSAYVEELSK